MTVGDSAARADTDAGGAGCEYRELDANALWPGDRLRIRYMRGGRKDQLRNIQILYTYRYRVGAWAQDNVYRIWDFDRQVELDHYASRMYDLQLIDPLEVIGRIPERWGILAGRGNRRRPPRGEAHADRDASRLPERPSAVLEDPSTKSMTVARMDHEYLDNIIWRSASQSKNSSTM